MADDAQRRFDEAVTLHRQGRLAEAYERYRSVVAEAPGHFAALHMLGVIQAQTGNPKAALDLIERSLALKPNYAEAYNDKGSSLRDLKRFDEALAAFERALKLKPDYPESLYNRANTLADMGRREAALASFARAIAVKPDFLEALNNRGRLLLDMGRAQEALISLDRALRVQPSFPQALNNRGRALLDLGRAAEALAAFERAVEADPSLAEGHNNRGLALAALNREEGQLESFERAIALKPDFAEALNNRAKCLRELGREREALISLDRALQLKPDFTEGWNNRGNVLADLKRLDEALSSFDRAIRLKPDYADAFNNRGAALFDFARFEEALESFDRAVALKDDFHAALNARGAALLELKRYEEAARSFAAALGCAPSGTYYAAGSQLLAKRFICDWSGYNESVARIVANVEAGTRGDLPLAFLGYSREPGLQQRCARFHAGDKYKTPEPAPFPARRADTGKIRVAYVSGEFHPHPVARLAAGLFEAHDRSAFEIFAISIGPEAGDPFSLRLEGAFDRFMKAAGNSDEEIVDVMRALDIDIAVDLMGYAGRSRPGIFLRRAAPVQVNYLGFAGTMGMSAMDYIVADRMVIAPEQHGFYDEKVVTLPGTYMPGDAKRGIGPIPTRSQAGLPESGFVFCSFNNSNKFAPDVFAIWMRLLAAHEGSVLWLPHNQDAAMANLKREAAARGVAAGRLVFAPYLEKDEDHLARLSLADLFLDTFPYNAHSSASDALKAGVPVLTAMGETFASRVGASLLSAAGLPEMIAHSLEEYESAGHRLAADPGALRALKQRLADARAASPLFDTARYARHLEAAFRTMHERQRDGLPPEAFAVAAIAE